MDKPAMVLDVCEDIENPGQFGWEITIQKTGETVDMKYGFTSYKEAEKAGELEFKKY